MAAAVPDEELGCPTDEPSKDGNSLFSQKVLDIQKQCQKDLFGDDSIIKDIDRAGKDAICVEFGREGIKCRDDIGCLDQVGKVADKCLKSTQKSAKQPGGKVADVDGISGLFPKGHQRRRSPYQRASWPATLCRGSQIVQFLLLGLR